VRRDILERPITFVAEQLARCQLVADEQIEPAVVVEIEPRHRMRRIDRAGEACLARHIGESAIAVVAQQRVAHRDLPAAAMDEEIEMAVVVVVGLRGVEAAQLRQQPRRLGAILERPVAVVVIETRRRAEIDARHHHVEQPIAIEIIGDGAAGAVHPAEMRLVRHLDEARHLHVGSKHVRGEPQRVRHRIRITPQHHR
jgi:hypothetical protein